MGFLVVVLIGAIAVAWIAILAETAGTPEGSFRSGTKTSWLLIAIFFGVIGAGVYMLAGRPSGEDRGQPSTANRPQQSTGLEGHFVYEDPFAKIYWCAQCSFAVKTLDGAISHNKQSSYPVGGVSV
jgi:hypothetical protein